MIFISIAISLLLLKLYPEYKIYILLFLLLSFILIRRTEGLPNEININEDWDQGVLSSDNTDNAKDPTKIKISSDPVRNCYYKLSPDSDAPCLPFPSDPTNFNQDKNERSVDPENRKPLFFDFLPIWGDSTPYSKDTDDHHIISIQKKTDGHDYKPAHVLSPINVIQPGYSESDKFTTIDNIAPSGITKINEKISYRSLTERERRSKIIRDTKNNTGGEIDVYRGWSGSNNGKIKIEGTDLMELDEFVNRINKNNILIIEQFNKFKDCSKCTPDEACDCTNNINDLDDKYSWYADIIKIYVNNDGSTGYFLDNLNAPGEYTFPDQSGIIEKFNAPFMEIWNDDGDKSDDEKKNDDGDKSDDSDTGEWISKEGVDKDDLSNFNGDRFKNIKLKNSKIKDLFDHIRNFKITTTGSYEARDDSKIIPYKDRRFVYDMITLADRSTNSEVSDIRYGVFKIIERTMTSKSLNSLEEHVKWNPTEPGYNTIDYPAVGSGNIDSVYADSTCTSEIDNYKYFVDPPYSNDDPENKYALLCSDSNKKVTYTPNDYELGDNGNIKDECPIGVLQNDQDFNRGLYVKCFEN